MAQDSNTMPPSGIGKLQISDFIKSVGLAVGANALLSLYTIIDSGAWPTSEDWADILRTSIAFMLAYLIKNLGTNNTGKFLKPNEPVVTVPAKELDEVIDKANEPKGQV